MDLFAKYFETETKADENGQCPMCYVGSWDHDPEAYKQCIGQPSYEGELKDCPEDQSSCIADYLYYEDRVYDTISFCELGRDCCK